MKGPTVNGSANKIFLGVISLLVTVAIAVGGYTLSQIAVLHESKVSIREMDLFRGRLARIEDKLDQALSVLYQRKQGSQYTPSR